VSIGELKAVVSSTGSSRLNLILASVSFKERRDGHTLARLRREEPIVGETNAADRDSLRPLIR
jgi:hypothetical protein